VAESTDADDADLLAGTTAVAVERREGSQTAAEHGRDLLEIELVRDLEDELLVDPNARGIAAVSNLSILVLGVVGVDLDRF
jgi:hypothetical protein